MSDRFIHYTDYYNRLHYWVCLQLMASITRFCTVSQQPSGTRGHVFGKLGLTRAGRVP